MSSEKPREWWIYHGAKGPVVFMHELTTSGAPGFHVIEKSAYDAVCDTSAKHVAEIEKLRQERDELRAENEQLRHDDAIKDSRAEQFESTVMATVAERDRALAALKKCKSKISISFQMLDDDYVATATTVRDDLEDLLVTLRKDFPELFKEGE